MSKNSGRAWASRTAAMAAALLAGTAGADVDDLLVTEVDPANDVVEVTNTATTGFTTAAILPFSHEADTSSSIPSSTSFAAGESITFAVTGLSDTASDIWLYRDTSFADPASVISGMQYGAAGAGIGQVNTAVAAGKWTSATASVALPSPPDTLQLNAVDGGNPANWLSRGATANAWFNTGTEIANPIAGTIAKSSVVVELQTLASGLTAPVAVIAEPGGADRLYVIDQGGQIRLINGGSMLATPFLQIMDLVSLNPGYDERGLLGFALHPDFPTNPRVYTYSSQTIAGTPDFVLPAGTSGVVNHHSVIEEWQLDTGNPNVVDTATRRELMRVEEPQSNHNGGAMHFGPDGYLYVTLGDGGSSDDDADGHVAQGNAQDPTNILGSIIRIDVDATVANALSANGEYRIPADNPFAGGPEVEEIYAYGLRNPYSFSFDNTTGDLWIADVGQNRVEELDLGALGANYGWPLLEGEFFFDSRGRSLSGIVETLPVAPVPAGVTGPVAQYDHDDGISMIGGYVYRGAMLPAMAGKYIGGDFSTSFGSPQGRLWIIDTSTGVVEELQIGTDDRALGLFVKGFGQDADGELYVCGSTILGPSGTAGTVVKLVPVPSSVDSDMMAIE